MAAQHAGEAVAHLGCGLADRDSAGDIGGAISILRAGIDQQQIAWRDAAIALAADAIMHDRAIWSGAGNRRKRNILQRAGVAAEGFQRFDRVDFGELAAWRLAVDPSEKS